MTEQAVKVLEIVGGSDTAIGEQAHGRVMFVDAAGKPVDVVGDSYPAMTAAELQAGTSTELRVVSPKVIHDEIARQVAAAKG